MRTNADEFNEFNQASLKNLRLVLKFGFSTPYYITSHAGIPNIPANRLDDSLKDVSSISQRLIPDQGRSEIGSMSFGVVDIAGAVTTEFRSQRVAGDGLAGVTVELYRGGAGMDWSDFRLEQTQEISNSVVFKAGTYKVQCNDIQRSMRKDLFDLAKTRLAAQLDAGASTLSVFDTSDFEACSHVASFGDQPSGSYYYLKIKYKNGFEIVRATGKTATTFTGVTRGLFGTSDVDHILPSGSDADAGVEVSEYVYLELPAPAMAYALLTGNIIGGGTIPTRWNLGISTALADQPSFEDIGEDWFDSSNYANGLIFRFQGLAKTDGKRFIEREVCLLSGAFLKVGADGKLYMRRMTGVISTSDFVQEINADNAIAVGEAKHDLNKVRNTYDVEWSYVEFPGEARPRFVRRDILIDATSINTHGEAKPLALKFKGLHNERHTYTTLINRFDALRDRYAGPPIELKVNLMPSMNDLEVGDIVRAKFDHIPDYSDTGTLDRSFEIQRITINQRTGRVSADLFGSTQKADPIVDGGAGANAELPDSWYSSAGTELSTVLTINGSGVITANGTLTGAAATRTIFYYLGDLTINSGVTLTIEQNVEIRVRGQFQINGTLRVTDGHLSDTPGFVGTTYGGRGMLVDNGPDIVFPADRVEGMHAALPVLEIENDAGAIKGIPADMRSSGGGIGGQIRNWESIQYVTESEGGAGGRGGGSCVTVSRGAGYGVAGESVLSGEDGVVGQSVGQETAGSGGGGAPGCLVHLLDGSSVTFPILAGNVVAAYGTSPIGGSDAATQGKAKASDPIDLGVACARVAYVPKSRDPYPDYESDNISNDTSVEFVFQRADVQPATPSGNGIPSGWSDEPLGGLGPLWFSKAKQEENGTTVGVWSTPVRLDGGGGTAALNVGRRANSPDDWYSTSDQSAGLVAEWTIETVAGPVWPTALQVSSNDDVSENLYSERITFDPTKKHRVSCWVRQTSGDRRNYLLVAFYDDAGDLINNSSSPVSDAVGWDGVGANHYYSIVNTTFPSDWTKYSFEFGGDSPASIPTGAVSLAIGGFFTRDGAVGTASIVQIQDPFVVEVASPAVSTYLTNVSHVVPANSDGTGYSLTGAGGDHKVLNGQTDVTSQATHSVVGGATKNGLTMSVNSSGVYSLSGASWTSDSEMFTLRANINGVDYDQVYTIAKAKQGGAGAGGRVTAIGADVADVAIDPADAEASYRVHSDGKVYKKEGTAASYVEVGTWLQTGANTDYQVMFEHLTGDTPSGTAVDTWLDTNSTHTWTLTETVVAGAGDSLTFNVKFRDKVTLEALSSASGSIAADVDSGA